jgi:putative lipoprotein
MLRCGRSDAAAGNHDNFQIRTLLLRIAVPGLLLLVLASCASAGGNDPDNGAAVATVTGSVSYRERIALPADAVIVVQLRDVSRMDVAAKLISEQTIKPQHSVPIPFSLAYDPGEIDERMTYAIFASIRGAGRLLFVTDRSYQVLTHGNPHHLDLILVQP